MLKLVIGGAASGKSAYAETLAVKLAGGGPLYYLATMHNNPKDPETVWRIEKHRRERAGKGFETLEKEADFRELLDTERMPEAKQLLQEESTALLEDISNLLANEMFFAGTIPFDDPTDAGALATAEAVRTQIIEPILAIAATGTKLVVVSNQIAEDLTDGYDPVTKRFILGLQQINRELGKQADEVYEVVCSIPLLCGGTKNS